MAAERMPGLMPTSSTRTSALTQSRSRRNRAGRNAAMIASYELALQRRTDALQLRRAREGQEGRLERRPQSARAEASPFRQKRRSHLLLPHRQREGGGRRRQGARRLVRRPRGHERQGG